MLGVEALQPPRLRSPRPLVELGLLPPSLPGRVELWRRTLDGAASAEPRHRDAGARLQADAGRNRRRCREARVVAGPRGCDDASCASCVERRLRNELGDLARRLDVSTTWDDVVLAEDAAGRVRELIHRKLFEEQVYRDWGFDARIAYGSGLIALFSGPPGTGKTLLAGLIARELGLELYQVDLSQIFSRWVGETEKSLARLFDQAERAHAVLLFDEADALFAKRTEVEDSHDRYANVAVNFLLQRLEQYGGVAILTTNKDTHLDEALRRRLSLHLRSTSPRSRSGCACGRSICRRRCPVSRPSDLAQLAQRYELTGGYIKNIAVRAAFFAAASSTPISTALIHHAALLELEDMGHVVFRSPEDEDEDGTAAAARGLVRLRRRMTTEGDHGRSRSGSKKERKCERVAATGERVVAAPRPRAAKSGEKNPVGESAETMEK